MKIFPTILLALKCLCAAIIKCECHLEKLYSDKFNEDNSKLSEKVPRKGTTPCQKYILQSQQLFERKAKIVSIVEQPRKNSYVCRGNFYCRAKYSNNPILMLSFSDITTVRVSREVNVL